MLIFTSLKDSIDIIIDYEYENLFVRGETPTAIITKINKCRVSPLTKTQEIQIRDDIVSKMNNWLFDVTFYQNFSKFQKENEAFFLMV